MNYNTHRWYQTANSPTTTTSTTPAAAAAEDERQRQHLAANENGDINIYTAWAAHSQRASATCLEAKELRGGGGGEWELSRRPYLQVEENRTINISIGG